MATTSERIDQQTGGQADGQNGGQDDAQPREGFFTRVGGWVGFLAGMVLMFVYIPTSDSGATNALVGAACGAGGSIAGSLVGSALDAVLGT